MSTARTESSPAISVIIPARNEAAMIGVCLDSLVRMEPSVAFEVILVDNGSTDDTVAIAASYSARLDIRILNKPVGHISALRNMGAAAARGEILAFLDADCLVPATWLGDIVRCARGDRIVGAHYGIPDTSSWVGRSWYGRECEEKRDRQPYLPSGDLIILREKYYALGGFDERIQTNEDYEFCQRAWASGMEVVAFPELGVTHLGTPQTLRGFYRKHHWHGRDVLAVTWREFPAIRNAKAVCFAVYSLGCIGLTLFGLCAAALGGPYSYLIGGVAAFVGAAFVLAARAGRGRTTLPLTILFLAYGIARAQCILDAALSIGRRGKSIPSAPAAARAAAATARPAAQSGMERGGEETVGPVSRSTRVIALQQHGEDQKDEPAQITEDSWTGEKRSARR